MSLDNNLLTRLGEKILTEKQTPFQKVVRVDVTLADDLYPVNVRYVGEDGYDAAGEKTYDDLHAILAELEDIDEEIRASQSA